MKALGVVEEITSDSRYIVRCDDPPDIGDRVFADGVLLGKVGRVFGPIDSPYASVTPVAGASTRKGNMTFFEERKRDGKDKRRNRRN